MNSAKLSVEYLPVGDLRPYERNAKKHPRQQLDQIKRSILDMGNGDPEKGFLDPIPVPYWQRSKAKGKIVTRNGEVISCELYGDPETVTGEGYVNHWATCPKADKFRRRK